MSEGTRILVVEDNPTTLKMLRVVLESEGFHVETALDARTALERVQRAAPDLVLQDLILPDMSGFELVRQLRAIPGAADIPILAISGFLGLVEDRRSADAGFTDILVKPVEPTRLVEAVRNYLPSGAPSLAPPEGSNRRLLIVDDDLVQLKLERLHFMDLGFEVATATSAAEAIRLNRSYRPEVILSDVLMPGMDGFEFCQEVRRDPELTAVPVVLLSSQYRTRLDEELALRVGANALVPRSPGFAEAAAAVFAALKEGPRAAAGEPSLAVKLEQAHIVIRQLERQLAVGSGLAQRCTFQAAQLSLLSGVADALARNADVEAATRDVLAATLDAAGISKGALLLKQKDGQVVLRHSIGFSDAQRDELVTFFGHQELLDRALESQAALSIPSVFLTNELAETITAKAGSSSVHIVPLISDARGVGVIVLAARRTDVTSEDAVAFARAMGNQMVQSLELTSTFSRLAASEARYRTLLQSANDAIAVLGADGTISEVNRRWEEIAGIPEKEFLGRHVTEFAQHDGEGLLPGSSRQGPSSESRRTRRAEVRKPDGTTVLLEFSTTPLELAGERLFFSVGRDVTAQVRAQEQLLVSERMASMGTLAASVAHEINNPLSAISGNLEFADTTVQALLKELPASPIGPALDEAIRDAREAADRVRNIVRDLRVFSRAEEHERGPVDIHHVLNSSLRITANEIRHRAQLTKVYGDVPAVLGNESRLGQVFLNLLVNASQAITEGDADSNEILVRTYFDDASARVFVEVTDTGTGIPADTLRKLFNPFVTTKPASTGTGLGLAICKRIVTGLGGDIDVESKIGAGTTFRVALKVAEGEPRPPSAIPISVPLVRRGRILVVDDEPMIGKLALRCLGASHDVTTMTDATTALAWISRGERFDVILCDLMMPVMTGFEFYEALLTTAPDQAERTIFLTGGAFTPKTRSFLAEVANERLEKPFKLAALRALVNARLQ